MANIKSQIKRNRQNERRRLRNKAVKSEIKTRMKKVVQAVETDSPEVEELYRLAQRKIDTAAAKGILPKRTAARRKARLARQLQEAGKG